MTVAATTTPQLRAGTGRWVSSARWDLFWMFSALWGSALLAAGALAFGNARVGALLIPLGLVFAACHSWATTYAVLASPPLREAPPRHPVNVTLLPLPL